MWRTRRTSTRHPGAPSHSWARVRLRFKRKARQHGHAGGPLPSCWGGPISNIQSPISQLYLGHGDGMAMAILPVSNMAMAILPVSDMTMASFPVLNTWWCLPFRIGAHEGCTYPQSCSPQSYSPHMLYPQSCTPNVSHDLFHPHLFLHHNALHDTRHDGPGTGAQSNATPVHCSRMLAAQACLAAQPRPAPHAVRVHWRAGIPCHAAWGTAATTS